MDQAGGTGDGPEKAVRVFPAGGGDAHSRCGGGGAVVHVCGDYVLRRQTPRRHLRQPDGRTSVPDDVLENEVAHGADCLLALSRTWLWDRPAAAARSDANRTR